ncbi:hypothetical protein BHM03_00063105 [Ensete ventricosum]|nr:hypothetical protein BHM03_00063105 [Ensete ventricosum]
MIPSKMGCVVQRLKELYKAHRGLTQEWVGEGELPRERTQSEVAEALRCIASTIESNGGGALSYKGMIRTTGELDCFSAHIRWEPDKSEDKTECNAMDSRAMGLAAPWYHKGRIFVESSIPCSHGGRTLVVKGAEEIENAETNSKYQDKAERYRPRNFIRPTSTGFLSPKRMGETEYPSSLIYFAEKLCTSLKTLQRNLIKDELSNPHQR